MAYACFIEWAYAFKKFTSASIYIHRWDYELVFIVFEYLTNKATVVKLIIYHLDVIPMFVSNLNYY